MGEGTWEEDLVDVGLDCRGCLDCYNSARALPLASLAGGGEEGRGNREDSNSMGMCSEAFATKLSVATVVSEAGSEPRGVMPPDISSRFTYVKGESLKSSLDTRGRETGRSARTKDQNPSSSLCVSFIIFLLSHKF